MKLSNISSYVKQPKPNNSGQGLGDWLQVQNTNLEIWNELVSGLQQWQNNDSTKTALQTTEAQEQQLLGWEMMMEGIISCQWRETQVAYWKTYKSQKSSKRWKTALIQKLLQIAWDIM